MSYKNREITSNKVGMLESSGVPKDCTHSPAPEATEQTLKSEMLPLQLGCGHSNFQRLLLPAESSALLLKLQHVPHTQK